MKQTITTKQLNELSWEGKGKLRSWWTPIDPPLLSIGQLIEFLDDNGWVALDRNKKGWKVFVDQSYGEFEKTLRPELVDALWEVVKEELEK